MFTNVAKFSCKKQNKNVLCILRKNWSLILTQYDFLLRKKVKTLKICKRFNIFK